MRFTSLVIVVVALAVSAAVGQRSDTGSLPLGQPTESLSAAEGAPEPGSGDLGVVQTVGSLGLVVALIVGVAAGAKWLAKKQGGLAAQLGAGGRAPSGVAEVLARYPLARGQSIVLMRIGQRVLVTFHATGGKNGPTMTRLSEIVDPEEIADLLVKTREAEAEDAQNRFSEAIAAAESRHVDVPARAPSEFRSVQTSPEGDRVELLSVDRSSESGPDAVTRLRERLAGLGVPASAGAGS